MGACIIFLNVCVCIVCRCETSLLSLEAIFAEDFFLTYLSYMTTDELCSKLLDKYIASDGLLVGGRGEGGEGERTDGAKYLSVPGGEPVTVSNGHGPIDSTSRKRKYVYWGVELWSGNVVVH